MAYDTDEMADLLAKQMQAFSLVVLEKKSLRKAAEAMQISHTTVKAYVTAYKKAIASERVAENVEERRASFDAELEMVKAKALAVYAYCMGGRLNKETGDPIIMPLAAVGAINSYTTTLTHQRAVQGLDTAKEVKQENTGEVRIIWDDGPVAGVGDAEEVR